MLRFLCTHLLLLYIIKFVNSAPAGGSSNSKEKEDSWKDYDVKNPPQSFVPPWVDAPVTDVEIKLPEPPRPMAAPPPNDMVRCRYYLVILICLHFFLLKTQQQLYL